MSIGETLLVYAGIPIAVILVVTGWAFASMARSAPRYRPGRPFTFTPVWYLAEGSPEEPDHPALPAAGAAAGPPARPASSSGSELGGARGTW